MTIETKGRQIQFLHGEKTDLPNLAEAQPAFCTDTEEVFIGSQSGNKKILTEDDISLATQNNDGLLSKLDKSKLDGIEDYANHTIIVDDLNTADGTKALSANQGKNIKDLIDAITGGQVGIVILDDLNSTLTNAALSANKGKELNETKADKTLATSTNDGLLSSTDKDKLDRLQVFQVEDSLISTSTTDALSANIGRQLNDKTEVIDTAFVEHKNNNISSEQGVHKLRYYDEKLEIQDEQSNWNEVKLGKDIPFVKLEALNAQNVYTVDIPDFHGYEEGVTIQVMTTVLNTVNPFGISFALNINGLGVKFVISSSDYVTATHGILKRQAIYTLIYNGTSFIMQNALLHDTGNIEIPVYPSNGYIESPNHKIYLRSIGKTIYVWGAVRKNPSINGAVICRIPDPYTPKIDIPVSYHAIKSGKYYNSPDGFLMKDGSLMFILGQELDLNQDIQFNFSYVKD